MKKLLILASFLLFVFVSVESTGFTVFTFQQNKTLVKLSTNPTVYWLQNNRIYGVFASTLSTMQSNNMPGWSTINTVSSLPFPQGPNFIGTGSDSNGLLIKLTSNSAVYLVTNGKKEFLSSDEFNRRGFSFNDVIDVPQAIINMFPTAVDAMQYISQTIPDGTTFNSNTPFTMTWRLQNTGQTTWGSYNAVWIQNPTSGNPSENLSSPLRVSTSVPVASPGNAIDLTVTMIAPSTPGTHYSYWQLQNSSGNNFGIQFFIRIVVAQPVDAMQYISQNPLDGMAFDPNTPFTMTWQLKNTGNTNWSNYDAVWIQNPTSGNPSENLTSPLRISASVPFAAPGNTINLSITMIAPSTPGTHYSYWQLQNTSGTRFGVQFFIRIVVNQPIDAMQYISQNPVDGASFDPNTPFTMTWQLKNTGNTNWSNYDAVWIQNPTSGNPSENLTSPLRISASVPFAAPGNTINLSITMIAPSTPGTHYSYWQLQNSSGARFGIQFFIRIVVNNLNPLISSISPTSPVRSSVDQNVVVNGNRFQQNLTITITFPSGASTILSGAQIQNITSTSFTMLATLNALGNWVIKVNNPDGSSSNTFSFAVLDGPLVSSISPPTPISSTTSQDVTIYGTNIDSNSTVTFSPPNGNALTVKGKLSTQTGSKNERTTAPLFIAPIILTPPGLWTLRVNNPGGSQSNPYGFTVRAADPTIDHISPDPVPAGQDKTLIVSGINFRDGFSASVTTTYGTFNIENAGLTFINSNEVRVRVTMYGTPQYTATLRISYSNGQSTTGTFQVTGTPSTGPLTGTIGIWDGQKVYKLRGSGVTLQVYARRSSNPLPSCNPNCPVCPRCDDGLCIPATQVADSQYSFASNSFLLNTDYDIYVDLSYHDVISQGVSCTSSNSLRTTRLVKRGYRASTSASQLLDFDFKPPLVMVHGIRSCFTKWHNKQNDNANDCEYTGNDPNYWESYARSLGFITFTPNYNYNINPNSGNGFNDWEARATYVATQIRNNFVSLTGSSSGDYPPWVYVAHSMGGLIGRVLTYKTDDLNKPLVRKLKRMYLLGTPNSGSYLTRLGGNELVEYLSPTYIRKTFNTRYNGLGSLAVVNVKAYAGNQLGALGDGAVSVESVSKIIARFDTFLLPDVERTLLELTTESFHFHHFELGSSDSRNCIFINRILPDVCQLPGGTNTNATAKPCPVTSAICNPDVLNVNPIDAAQANETSSAQAAVINSQVASLAGNQMVMIPFVVSATDSIIANGLASSGSATFSLVNPSGQVIDFTSLPPTAGEHISGEFGESFLINNPVSGSWSLKAIAGSSGATITVIAAENSPLGFEGFITPNISQGQSAHLLGKWIGNMAGVTSPAVTAQIFDHTGMVVATVNLFDDGNHGDGAAGDGVFGGDTSNLSNTGVYSVVFTTQGNLNGLAFTRWAYALLDVVASSHVLTGSFSDVAIDSDSDGTYDNIRETVEVSVASAGGYLLSADLYDAEGYFISHGIGYIQANVGGVHSASLDFNMAGVTCGQFASTFTIKNLTLSDAGTLQALDIYTPNPTTQIYQGSLFGCVGGIPSPGITSIQPDSMFPNSSGQVVISGSSFLNGAQVTFGSGITVSSVTYGDSSTILAQISVSSGATPGPRDVTVMNPDGHSSTGAGLLNIATDQPPSVSINNLSDQQAVSGVVTVSATATDDHGIQKVEFYLDGVLSATDTSFPYQFVWDTITLSNGTHTLATKAYDTTNQTSTAQINVIISCITGLSSQSQMFPVEGGSGMINVTAGNGCSWEVTRSDLWITITSGNGTGNGTVSYTIAANTGAARTGTITVGGQLFTITQDFARSLSGAVNYCASSSLTVVPGVQLTASGTPGGSSITNNSGAYQLTGLGAGAYTVTPAKSGDVTAIDTGDSTKILKYLVGSATLTGCQPQAADTNQNAGVDTGDATQILKYLVGNITAGNHTGEWQFSPPNRSYPSLASDQTGQNYDAILLGEVNANWVPAGPTTRLPSGATPITVTLPSASVGINLTTFTLPITVSDTTGMNVTGYRMRIEFDPSVVNLTGVSTTGTLSSGFSVQTNALQAGELLIAASGSTPLSGAGMLLNLNFTRVGAQGTSTSLTFTTRAQFPGLVFQDPDGNTIATTGVSGSLSIDGAPTVVKLERFTATGYDSGVYFEWKTGLEVDNLGFNIYREHASQNELVTPEIIAGSALLTGKARLQTGRTYAWWDSASKDQQEANYYLEDVGLNGARTLHGPFKLQRIEGKPPQRSTADVLSRVGRGVARAKREPFSHKPAQSDSQMQKQQELANIPAVKLWVRDEGWYKVTQREMLAAGLNPQADPRKLQLYLDGVEQPLLVSGEKDGSLDPADAIEFYATGQDTPSTYSHVYWLVEGKSAGKRINVVNRQAKAGGAASFSYTAELRQRSVYFSALKNGEEENFFGGVVTARALEQKLTLQHLDNKTQAAELEVALQGVTDLASTLDHSVRVMLNGVVVGRVVFDGRERKVEKFSVYASYLKEGDNSITLEAEGGQMDISLVDYIRVTYLHTYTADQDELKLTAGSQGEKMDDAQAQSVGGFSNALIRVIDVTDPATPQEMIGSIDKAGSAYQVTVNVAGRAKTLLAFTSDQMKHPTDIAANQPSSIRSENNGADLVIVTRSQYTPLLQPLVELRRKEGLSVSVVDVEDVLDEFSYGEKTPQALKDFFSYVSSSWKKKPRFVLIGGDGTYDPKNYLGGAASEIVPIKLVDTAEMETASDCWFADFNNDGVEDVAIGRLPFRDQSEAAVMVAKIISYEQASSSEEALLVSDSNDSFDFEQASNQLKSLLPSGLRVNQLNRGRLDAETARKQLFDAVNRGQKIINYTGHGNVDQWRGNLLTNADALLLQNRGHLSVFVMMTCLNGYFDDPTLRSLSEELMRSEGGAVAVWASSGMTVPSEQTAINQQLYRILFESSDVKGQLVTIGEAVMKAKAASTDADVRRSWVLLGDPTMKLK